MQHLPPESALYRSEQGGIIESERVQWLGLGFQYLLARAWAAEPDKFPDLEEFFPDLNEVAEPEPRELTFDDWFQALLPMAR